MSRSRIPPHRRCDPATASRLALTPALGPTNARRRATTLGMRTRQLRSLSIKELASALATAYRTKMRAQAVPPFSICYLDEGGEWEQLTTRTWLDVRDEITDLRVMASAADSPPRFSSSKSARDYSGGYAPVSSR